MSTWLSLLRKVAFSIIFRHLRSKVRHFRRWSFLKSLADRELLFFQFWKTRNIKELAIDWRSTISHPRPRNIHQKMFSLLLTIYFWNWTNIQAHTSKSEWQLIVTSKTASSPPCSLSFSLKFPPVFRTAPEVSVHK